MKYRENAITSFSSTLARPHLSLPGWDHGVESPNPYVRCTWAPIGRNRTILAFSPWLLGPEHTCVAFKMVIKVFRKGGWLQTERCWLTAHPPPLHASMDPGNPQQILLGDMRTQMRPHFPLVFFPIPLPWKRLFQGDPVSRVSPSIPPAHRTRGLPVINTRT